MCPIESVLRMCNHYKDIHALNTSQASIVLRLARAKRLNQKHHMYKNFDVLLMQGICK